MKMLQLYNIRLLTPFSRRRAFWHRDVFVAVDRFLVRVVTGWWTIGHGDVIVRTSWIRIEDGIELGLTEANLLLPQFHPGATLLET
jgi:hypothetical protein